MWSNSHATMCYWGFVTSFSDQHCPNFCDIIWMTASPPKASFQGTYCFATTLISLGRYEHEPNTILTSQAHWRSSWLDVHIQSYLLGCSFPFHLATDRPPHQPNESQKLATSCALKECVILNLLSERHSWIHSLKLTFRIAISNSWETKLAT